MLVVLMAQPLVRPMATSLVVCSWPLPIDEAGDDDDEPEPEDDEPSD